jgi:hypothetical protein
MSIVDPPEGPVIRRVLESGIIGILLLSFCVLILYPFTIQLQEDRRHLECERACQGPPINGVVYGNEVIDITHIGWHHCVCECAIKEWTGDLDIRQHIRVRW